MVGPVRRKVQLRDDSRARELGGALAVLGLLVLVILCLWFGPRLPGLAGDFLGVLAGIVSTPFLMEASFLAFGVLVVLTINHWRRYREGDEFVHLERVDGPGTEQFPEAERWVVYREPPAQPVAPDLLSRAEGAFSIEDFEETAQLLAEMPAAERDSPRGRRLRIRLARATGRHELADRLERDGRDQ